jgi:hypothetical protein
MLLLTGIICAINMHHLDNSKIILLVQSFGPFTTYELVEIVDYSRLNYKYLFVSQLNSEP